MKKKKNVIFIACEFLVSCYQNVVWEQCKLKTHVNSITFDLDCYHKSISHSNVVHCISVQKYIFPSHSWDIVRLAFMESRKINYSEFN